MKFKYYLPDEQSDPIPYETNTNALIIIGANGSGKSKLGAWIERQDFKSIHRIGAQRSLTFNENIALKSYSQAEDLVFWGSTEDSQKNGNKSYRWNWGEFTTTLMNDFENVLAALIALKNNENDHYIEQCKLAELNNTPNPHTPETSIDKLFAIWKDVFPQRELFVEDSKFLANIPNKSNDKYSATQMSDGERSVLYLVAQVLCVPENKTLIIDEPEIHLHRSIMNRLWSSLEKHRPDCLFIFITHDTQFAAMHKNADKIWIQDFDGKHWRLKKIEDNDLPEELLFDILGSRNNVLFVEGEKNSFDTQLYTIIFPGYYIVPCGSCTQVIERTKAFNNNPNLHNCKVYGIIDRDYRTNYEIEKHKENNIFTLNVAEVENLFITEEIVTFMANHMGQNKEKVFEEIKKYVIDIRFKNQIDKQVCQSVVAQIKYKLTSANISNRNNSEAKKSLANAYASIDYDEIYNSENIKFQQILKKRNYRDVIGVFNEKGIAKSIGHYFNIDNSAYCNTVINLLSTGKYDEIITALLTYFPLEIPTTVGSGTNVVNIAST